MEFGKYAISMTSCFL